MSTKNKQKLKEAEPTIVVGLDISTTEAQENQDPVVNTELNSQNQQSQQLATPDSRSTKYEESEDDSLTSISNADLMTMAQNPNLTEAQWFQACNELNRRNINFDRVEKPTGEKPAGRKSSSGSKSWKIAFVVAALLPITTVAVFYLQKPGTQDISPSKGVLSESQISNLNMAQQRTHDIQGQLGIRLANAIAKNGWTAREAAERLNVDQKSMSALLTGRTDAFDVDTEMQLLLSLDEAADLHASYRGSSKANQEAVEYYSRLLISQPTNIRFYLNRADGYRGLDNYELALADYSRCLELDPNNRAVLDVRAGVYSRLGNLDASLRDSNKLVQLFPNEDAGYMRRGLVFKDKADYPAAINDFTKVIQLGSTVMAPYNWRAECYEKNGNLKEAIADYEKIHANDPKDKFAEKKIDSLKKKLFATHKTWRARQQ